MGNYKSNGSNKGSKTIDTVQNIKKFKKKSNNQGKSNSHVKSKTSSYSSGSTEKMNKFRPKCIENQDIVKINVVIFKTINSVNKDYLKYSGLHTLK